MFKFFRNLFRRSVDGIIADISAKIDALDAATIHHSKQAEGHASAAEDLLSKAEDAKYEASRAESIATKLKALIS